MKIHVILPNPVDVALKIALKGLLLDGFDPEGFDFEHPDAATADLVIVGDKRELERVWNERQQFIVFPIDGRENRNISLPKNARGVSMLRMLPEILTALTEIKEIVGDGVAPGGETATVKTGVMHEPRLGIEPHVTLRVLVVDDTPENLQGALALLGDHHFVMLANGFAEGGRLIESQPWDVVLTDLHMPLGSDAKTALSSDAIKIGETVPCGMFLVFRATKLGAKVAVVTDANHHQDWSSALFDTLREAQTINGRPVLLMNNIGKRWDEALRALRSL